MRIGVFGGTFSPPHKGHVNAAACFQREFDLDRLLIVPAALPPNKAGEKILAASHRVAMCRLAFAGIPGCEVSEMELLRGGTSYTYLTLSELTAPGRELYLLMGSDMFLTPLVWMPNPVASDNIFVVELKSDTNPIPEGPRSMATSLFLTIPRRMVSSCTPPNRPVYLMICE